MDILTHRLKLSTAPMLGAPALYFEFGRGLPLRIQAACFTDADIATLTGVVSVTMMVRASQEDTSAAALMSKTVASDAFASCTTAQWLARTHQQLSFEFSAAECNLSIDGTRQKFWVVFKALLDDGSELILGSGWASCIEANATPAGDPPENPDPGISGAAAAALVAATQIDIRNNGTHVQWKRAADTAWINLIALSDLAGAPGSAGTNGAAPELQVSGTLLQWRYAGSGGAWTTLVDLDTLAIGLAVTETVPAVAQVTNITISTNSASDLDGDYMDVPVIGATVRAWFNVDNATSPPAVPSPGRLIPIAISSSGNASDFFAALAAALDADPDLDAYYLGGVGAVTQPAGALTNPTSTDPGNIGLSVAVEGVDAYDRLIQIDASQVTNVPPQAVNMGEVYRVLASLSDSTGQSVPLTQLLDLVIGSTRGSMIVRGAASWQQLAGSGLLRLISGADPELLNVSGMLVNSSYHEKRDPASITGSTFGSVMTAAHTPKFANSTIIALVFATVGGAASQVPSLRLTRGGTALLLGDAANLRTRVATSGGVPGASALSSATFAGKDTPGVTTPVTYTLELASHSTGTVRLNATGTDSDTAAFQRGSTSILFLEFAA